MTARVIGVATDEGVEWHAGGAAACSDYDTLCGIDANDSVIGHHGTTPAPRGQKITCPQCFAIWRGVSSLNLRQSSFDLGGRS